MKRRISIAVDKNDNQIPNATGIPISGLVNNVIGKEVRRIKTEEWKKENREGMREVARFIAQHGSFADENRNW
ncbi:type II toxin-antitoxin system antitoxin CcdA [Pectobacterium aroidearum]|uniref:type II toxin-antitoxin system antitoxin CcdA n=1 Tax=Pectobacterium aroidearum TaxID=1201031 RepID=UPI002114E237|nr:type II toxin-antitoxin system antitoxin CcdA [Pectobacterium aroidearum]UUE44181.1 type II toxin-antitoxin system antitoxin CcdA [Pectobacterium aroidearum]UUE48400.1 type II toxin-antitoxin system antitoxin CcdA [Pectobacterium aroidearum]UUE52605.1 type II toxin-antitoxin system antitoxin CcdA [Pectobacterium aroidearum]UUE61015.1 type II toxin-antitoxin system antitoxin CcdA [Pectobacterium aroidearum]UUE65238.1 type II toxin-antitoxin system antitoxin CcdA [Pectobacterium aroidearum]